jgi:hypothetical protein
MTDGNQTPAQPKNSIPEIFSDAYYDGWSSAIARGLKHWTNPYPIGSKDHLDWERGCSDGGGLGDDPLRRLITRRTVMSDNQTHVAGGPISEGADLIAAARTARDVLRQVSMMRGKIGPIATAAQQAAWQLSAALGEHEEQQSGNMEPKP